MREVLKTHERTSLTSLQKSGNYSREVLQPDDWQLFAPAVHMAKWTCPFGQNDACFEAKGRVEYLILWKTFSTSRV